MITKLIIKNFESWEKGVFIFDKGMNCITGPTGNGKSAIINVITWIVENRPLGDEFRSDWGGTTSAKIFLINEDGKRNKIERRRSSTENVYIINGGQPINAGTSVPAEVKEILNMSTINIQHQLDKHFLLSESAGEVARHFNRMAHLDDIHKSQKNIKSWSLDIDREIKSSEIKLEEKIEKLEEYRDIDKLENRIEVLEGLENDDLKLQKEQSRIARLIDQIYDVNEELKSKKRILKSKLKINKVIDLMRKRDELSEKENELDYKIRTWKSKLEDIEAERVAFGAKQQIEKVLELIDLRDDLRDKAYLLQDKLNIIHGKKLRINACQYTYKTMKKRFEDNMPGVCPLCGRSG